jgi:hypothetical protein
MIAKLKRAVLDFGPVRRAWAGYRAHQWEQRHGHWVEQYGMLAEERGLRYSEDQVRAHVAARLKGRPIPTRRAGEVHTGMLVLKHNWGIGMVWEAEFLGPVSAFDREEQGFGDADLLKLQRLRELQQRILRFVEATHRQRPLDWLLIPCHGKLILRDTLREIRERWGIPLVNQWLDCKQSFELGLGPHGQDSGMRDIAPEFDLVWTSARSMCEPYLAMGACPLFLGEGFSPRLTPRVNCAKMHEVGFLGVRYGLRPDYIAALRRGGLRVVTRGDGWGTSEVPLDQMGRFYSECKVNLGMGGVGYSMQLTTLKGRDFEVPGAGGTYLTTFNPDLSPYFHIGEEIVCYRTVEEMVWLARQLVRDEAWREALAARAHARAMREHRWLHRFQHVLELLGVLGLREGRASATVSDDGVP